MDKTQGKSSLQRDAFNPLHQRQLASNQHLLDDDLSLEDNSYDASFEDSSCLEDDPSREWDAWSNSSWDSSTASSRAASVRKEEVKMIKIHPL